MSYDLHIEGEFLTKTQWISFVNSNADLKITNFVEATNPMTDDVIKIDTTNSATSETGIFFNFREYQNKVSITISNPSDDLIPYLKSIAHKLNANLIGDEGEEY